MIYVAKEDRKSDRLIAYEDTYLRQASPWVFVWYILFIL